MTVPVKTKHICINYTRLESGTFVGHSLWSVNFICFQMDLSTQRENVINVTIVLYKLWQDEVQKLCQVGMPYFHKPSHKLENFKLLFSYQDGQCLTFTYLTSEICNQ